MFFKGVAGRTRSAYPVSREFKLDGLSEQCRNILTAGGCTLTLWRRLGIKQYLLLAVATPAAGTTRLPSAFATA
jgi:hypothetical protein